MPTRLVRLAIAAALFSLAPSAVAKDGKPDNPRQGHYKDYDKDGDGKWGWGDNRRFKKDHRNLWDNLNEWCDDAKEKPKKYDVDFPKGEKESKSKCKKHKKTSAYMKAWVKETKPDQEPAPAPKPAPSRGGDGKRGG